MKTLAIIMSLFFSAGLSSNLLAQEEKQSREDKKQERKKKIEMQYQVTKEILESKEYVLEANYLSNKYGQRIPVSPSINFIKVDSGNAVIQIGSQSGLGYNGVGGITTEGEITDYEFEKNEKKNTFDVNMTVMTNLGIYDIFMSIGSDGYASARMHGMTGGKLTYTGDIVPRSESYVYQGTTTY